MTIKEVAKKYDISQDTIRYYEKIGLIPKVPRTASRIRDFDEKSLKWIEFIKCMRLSGMEIETLLKYVQLYKEGKDTVLERKSLLEEQKNKLLEKQKNINTTIDRLNYKLMLYDDIIAGKRKDFMEEI